MELIADRRLNMTKVVITVLGLLCYIASSVEGGRAEKKDVYVDFVKHTKSHNCTKVVQLSDFVDEADVALADDETVPLVTLKPNAGLDDLLPIQELLSVRHSDCVVVFTTGDGIAEGEIEFLLNRTANRLVYVFEAKVDNVTRYKFQPDFMDNVIWVRELRSRNLELMLYPTSGPVIKMIWLKKGKYILARGPDCTNYKNLPRSSLKSRKDFVISSTRAAPQVIDKGHGTFGGMEYDIIEMLARKIGFVFSTKVENYSALRDPTTKKWGGLVGSIVDGTAQLGTSMPMLTPFSTSGFPVHHSPEIYSLEQIYMVPKPRLLLPYLNFVRPFTLTVWLCLLASLVVSSVMTFLLNKFLGDKSMSLWKISLDFYSTVWQQNLKSSMHCPKSMSYSIIFGIWVIIMTFKGAAYNCDLRSFIAKKVYEPPIESDEDIFARDIDVFVTANGGDPQLLYETSASPIRRELYKRIAAKKTAIALTPTFSSDDEQVVTMGGVRVMARLRVGSILQRYEQHYGYQPFRLAKTIVMSRGVVMIMPKYQPWVNEVDKNINNILAGGFSDQLMKRNQPFSSLNQVEKAMVVNDDVLEPYKFEHVAGPLIVLSMGLALSLIVAAFELAHGSLLKFNVVHFELQYFG